jgi:hypothetical protein
MERDFGAWAQRKLCGIVAKQLRGGSAVQHSLERDESADSAAGDALDKYLTGLWGLTDAFESGRQRSKHTKSLRVSLRALATATAIGCRRSIKA